MGMAERLAELSYKVQKNVKCCATCKMVIIPTLVGEAVVVPHCNRLNKDVDALGVCDTHSFKSMSTRKVKQVAPAPENL
jgi:hypothetical protein